MKKLLIALAVVALLPVAPAWADSFVLGSTNNTVSYQLNGNDHTAGGGSFDVSRLNGADLPWVYCVDLLHTISADGSYPYTAARADGVVNGSYVNNADKVAWLLGTYAWSAAGNSAKEAALQGLIWEAIYGAAFTFKPTVAQDAYFTPWLNTGIQSGGDVSAFRWLTPDSRCLSDSCTAPDCKQGLVTYNSVPDPGSSLLLLGLGLMGLRAWRMRWQ